MDPREFIHEEMQRAGGALCGMPVLHHFHLHGTSASGRSGPRRPELSTLSSLFCSFSQNIFIAKSDQGKIWMEKSARKGKVGCAVWG
jgi:hypothetical protein